jgi:FMN-dependent oxidoreductase (nitrilotriacetate monooxygenase family)
MLNLVTMPVTIGSHLGGWRHPDAWSDTVLNLRHIVQAAQTAERGKFDTLFLADGNGVRDLDNPTLFAANVPAARPSGFEPTTVLSALSMVTKHIGLIATSTTTYDEPYLVARRFASLDHLSEGRAGWNMVTTQYGPDSLNFSRPEHAAREVRYERAEEFVEVVKGLWDSWGDGAFIQDKVTGQFLDPGKVHVLNHVGKHFSVKGPLNISRSPQGQPVLFMAGQSEGGKELAARHADALFSAGDSKQICMQVYADIKGRMPKYGRVPEHMKILPGASVFVGRTSEEAEELYEELQSLISPVLGVHYLSRMLMTDLSGHPLDGPVPPVQRQVNGGTSLRTFIIEKAERDRLTIRQAYQQLLPWLGHAVLKGSPKQVADEMEDWYDSKACDGFMINFPVMPRGLNDFVDLVVPELQRRGLFRTEYTGHTLRETMGLPTPVNAHFTR